MRPPRQPQELFAMQTLYTNPARLFVLQDPGASHRVCTKKHDLPLYHRVRELALFPGATTAEHNSIFPTPLFLPNKRQHRHQKRHKQNSSQTSRCHECFSLSELPEDCSPTDR